MEYVRCNLCGRDSTELVFEVEERITGDHKKFCIVKCRSCGLVYVNPRPCKDEIILYYPAETYYAHRPPGKAKKVRRRLKALVREGLPGYPRNTGVFKRILARCLGVVLLSQIDIVVPFKENGKILDIGCGNGEMIGWMKGYGWDIHGVDIGKEGCEIAEKRGLKTFCGHLHEAQYPPEYFDAITINHVLEHVHDPLSMLRECNRILKKDGVLIVGVPNFGCIDSQLFGRSWYAVDVPRHLYHFTLESLGAMINAAGFKVDKWKPKLPLPVYYKPSIRAFRSANAGFKSLIKLIFKATLCQYIKCIFSRDKRLETSINLTVYASKYD